MGSPINVLTWCGWQKISPDQSFVSQVFRVGRGFLHFFSTMKDQWLWMFYQKKKKTMTGRYYRENVLPQVVSALNDRRPVTGTSRIMILHDNASAHKTGAVTQYLSENRITTFPHPAYSPDLAPCDFWLFPKLKELLAGNKCSCVQDLSKAVNSELRGIPKEEYRAASDKWRKRLQLCIQRGGEYFEGL